MADIKMPNGTTVSLNDKEPEDKLRGVSTLNDSSVQECPACGGSGVSDHSDRQCVVCKGAGKSK